MSSQKEYLNYIIEQLSPLEDVIYRPMMGEYLLYFRGKLVGGIYDDRLLVKPAAAVRKLLPSAPLEPPYPGGSPLLLVEDTDDRELLHCLFNALYDALPAPKPHRSRKGSGDA